VGKIWKNHGNSMENPSSLGDILGIIFGFLFKAGFHTQKTG
jgi:hypothetical protein